MEFGYYRTVTEIKRQNRGHYVSIALVLSYGPKSFFIYFLKGGDFLVIFITFSATSICLSVYFLSYRIFMAALRSRSEHYIWQLVVSSFFLFPRLFSAVADWMSTILPSCGFSANLECRSEMYCTRLAENTGRKKSPKMPTAHRRTTLSGYIFAAKAYIDNQEKKLVKQQYLLHMSSIW